MSSSTTLTFIFPEMTTLEVSIGNGVVPAYLKIAENAEASYSHSEAMSLMHNSNIVGAMTRFDQSLLNLLIDRHEARDGVLCRDAMQFGNEQFVSHEGLYFRVAHHR